MTITTKQKTLMTFILSAIFLTSVGVYQQASADSPHSTSLVATFGPSGDHPYSDVAESKSDTVDYTNPLSLPAGYFDAVEPTFQGGGAAPIADDTVTLYHSGVPVIGPVNLVVGYEEGEFTFTGLDKHDKYGVSVTISDLDDFGFTTDAAGEFPAPETVIVSANGKDIGVVNAVVGDGPGQTITADLGAVKVSKSGEITIGFNEIFAWDPTLPAPGPGTQPGIRVAQIALTPGHLIIEKTDVKVKHDFKKGTAKLNAKIDLANEIPTDGSSGAFGVGIITGASDAGPENVLAITTHMCAADHPLQGPDGTCPFGTVGVLTAFTDSALLNEDHDGAELHAHIFDLKPVIAGSLCESASGIDGLELDVARTFEGTGLPFSDPFPELPEYPNNNVLAEYDLKIHKKKIEVKNVPVSDLFDSGVESIVTFGIVPIDDGLGNILAVCLT